jgi:hypothetical protein
MTISLAFLAPSLVKAAVEGRLPHGIGLARLIDAPAEWDRQYRLAVQAPRSSFAALPFRSVPGERIDTPPMETRWFSAS